MRTFSIFRSGMTVLALVAVAAGLSGCRNPELNRALGKYDGFVIEKRGGKSQTERGTASITVDGSAPKSPHVKVVVKVAGREQEWRFDLASLIRGWVSLQIEEPGEQPVTVKLRPVRDTCYVPPKTPKGSLPPVRVCFERREWVLDLVNDARSVSFVFDRVSEDAMPVLEAPARYSPEALLSRAMNRSFDSRLEFESVIQARMNAQIAQWNLLPHFSLGTILGFVNFNGWMLVSSAGELLPFLLPTRWIRAKEAQFKFESERYAYILMRADSASLVEGLSIAVLRDEAALQTMRSEGCELSELRKVLSQRERMGLLPPGSSDTIDSLVIALDDASQLLESTIGDEQVSIAQGAGFMNPLAVEGIEDSSGEDQADPAIQGLPSSKEWAELALSRSYEIRQIDALIDEVKLDRITRYMNWIDPAGDSSSSLGLGFGNYLQIGASQLREAQVRREQQQAILLRTADDLVGSLEDADRSAEIAARSLKLQQSRIDRHLANLRLGFTVPIDDLAQAYQARMQAEIKAIEARFARRLALRRAQRLLFVGPYFEAQQIETKP